MFRTPLTRTLDEAKRSSSPPTLPRLPGLLALAAWLFFFVAAADAQANRNILIVVADDLGTDRLCAYRGDCEDGEPLPDGVAFTPTLDTMTRLGVQFDSAWSNPVCSTTRSTILTGQYSRRTGILAALGPDQVGLEDEDWTLPEMLREAAECSVDEPPVGCPIGLDVEPYQTAAFGKWHLNGEDAQDPDGPGELTGEAAPVVFGGFDYFEGTPANIGRKDQGDNLESYCGYRWWTVRNDDGIVTQDDGPPVESYATSFTVDRAIEWLGGRLGSEEPWLVYVAFHAPHTPLHHVRLEDGAFTCGDACADEMNTEENVDCYLEMVSAMDTELGRLLIQLGDWHDAGLTDFPSVLFLGDNGTESLVIDESIYPPVMGKKHAKTTVYEGGVRVPFIASGSRVPARGNVVAPVASTDIFLTVAALAGVGDLTLLRELPSGEGRDLDSFSFEPHLADEDCAAAETPCRDELFAEIRSSGNVQCNDLGECEVRPASDALAIRVAEHPDFKLIRGCLPCGAPQTVPQQVACDETDCADGECLYDLATTPTEDDNLLADGEPEPDSPEGLALAALRDGLDSLIEERLDCDVDLRGCPVSCPGQQGF